MTESEYRYCIGLASVKGLTYAVASALIDKYGSAEAVFTTEKVELEDFNGIHPVNLFAKNSKNDIIEAAEREIDFIKKNGITPIFFTDSKYPAKLKECGDAPIILYCKGDMDFCAGHFLSVVGTRHATPYGKEFCEKMIADMAAMFPDTVIVSGLAYGIDVCAHRSALECGLKTIAVLGHPLNTIYPVTHKGTALQISKQGALLSEYATNAPTLKVNFVARNRIIAGLSDATVIVESKESGGSLITADLAMGYNRDVFALPGDIRNDTSKGCNALIKDNKASLITSATDIADSLGWSYKHANIQKKIDIFMGLNETEAKIMEIIEREKSCNINYITDSVGIAASTVVSTVMGLEFKGLIKSYPGNIYRKI